MKEALELARLVIIFFLKDKNVTDAIQHFEEIVSCLKGEPKEMLPESQKLAFRISQYIDFIARNFEVGTEDLIKELTALNLEEIDINETDI